MRRIREHSAERKRAIDKGEGDELEREKAEEVLPTIWRTLPATLVVSSCAVRPRDKLVVRQLPEGLERLEHRVVVASLPQQQRAAVEAPKLILGSLHDREIPNGRSLTSPSYTSDKRPCSC